MKLRSFSIVLLLFVAGIPFVSHAASSPIRVDVIINANTTVPAFYAGRSVPSSGSMVTATALPIVGTSIVPKNYSYVWSINGNIQNGGVPTKSNVFTFKTPDSNQAILSVSVVNSLGKEVGNNTQAVPVTQPEIHFYEINPLKGQESHILNTSQTIPKETVTLRAEPYFLDTTIAQTNLQTQWEVDNKATAPDSIDPYVLTITKATNKAGATISFTMLNLTDYLQKASAAVTLRF